MNEQGISIVICCHNSATRIEETLSYVFAMEIPRDLPCEILVINNNSTDNTRSVTLNTYERSEKCLPLRVVDEPQPGLASARAKGIQESRYDIIIFCDDDNHLMSDYIIVAKKIVDEHPDVGIVGGWAKAKFSVKTSAWLEDLYPALAIGQQANAKGFVSWVYGAGMVIRKKIFTHLKEHNIQLLLSDRVGTKQTSGGDTEICLLAAFLGYKIYYTPQLQLFHAIASYRLTKQSFITANYRNVYPVIYLFLLKQFIDNPKESANRSYYVFLRQNIRHLIYFFPRFLLGKHRFYSFMMLFQNFQLACWMLVFRKRFLKTDQLIRKNLL